MAIPLYHETAEIEFTNSRKITSELIALIKQQSLQYDIIEANLKKTQNWDKEVQRRKLQKRHRKINNRNEWQRKASCWYINSNWSFKLADSTSNYWIWVELSKQQFWDSLRLHDGWEIDNLPTSCPCGSIFDIRHSMSCKKVVLYWRDITIYEN